MDSILKLVFLDRIYWIKEIFFSPAAMRLPAEGRIILTILLILSEILLVWNGFDFKN